MPLTESELNALLIARGMEFRYSCRGNLAEKLGLFSGADGSAGAGATFTTPGPEGAATGNVLTCSGAANSYGNFGTLANVGSRVAAGGGLTLSMAFKIPASVTSWKIGTDNPTSNYSLHYAVTGSNNQIVFERNDLNSQYIDTETAFATLLRDDTWRVFGITYNHITGVWRTYIDGELWSEGSTSSPRATANDILTGNFTNFMLGGFSFNGASTSATSPFISAWAEVIGGAKHSSEEEMREIAALSRAPFLPSCVLPIRVGPRAENVSQRFTSDVSSGNPIIVIASQSQLTLNGSGPLTDPEIRREINAMSNGRLRNREERIGDAADSNAPPGRLVSHGAGAVLKYLQGPRVNSPTPNDTLYQLDQTQRSIAFGFDASEGFIPLIAYRKESGGRGPITYVVRTSDMRPATAPTPLAGSETYQAIVASGTLFTAAELTGNGTTDVAYKAIELPRSLRNKYLQVELTNTGGSTANLLDIDWISRRNVNGPTVKIASRAGYHIGSFNTNHPGMWSMYAALKSYLNAPLHAVFVLGVNDGGNLTPSDWYTAFATQATAFFTAIPDGTLTVCVAPPVGAVNSTGNAQLMNARDAVILGAVKEYAEANPGYAICGANSRELLERDHGWTQWTQTYSRNTAAIGEFSTATTYNQGDVFWTKDYDNNATSRRYWVYWHPTPATVATPLNRDRCYELAPLVTPVDRIHHSERGQLLFARSIIQSLAAPSALVGYVDSRRGLFPPP